MSFQVIKTFKQSNDPDFEAKKNRIVRLTRSPTAKQQVPVIQRWSSAWTSSGPLNCNPIRKQWAPVAAGKGTSEQPRRRRRRATYTRPHGVRHLMAGYDLSSDRLYGHIVKTKGRTQFLAFARYLRSLHPTEVRIAIVLDNFSPHLSTKTDRRVGEWAAANNVELAYTPTYSSWLNRIEAQFQALRYFALDGTDHASHREQASMIRRYIIWRNRNAHDKALRELVKNANVAYTALVASVTLCSEIDRQAGAGSDARGDAEEWRFGVIPGTRPVRRPHSHEAVVHVVEQHGELTPQQAVRSRRGMAADGPADRRSRKVLFPRRPPVPALDAADEVPHEPSEKGVTAMRETVVACGEPPVAWGC